MVNVNDCGCPCEDNGKKKQIEERALSSINKIYTTEGATYFPDGTGMVTLPIPTTEQMQAIASVPEMASDIKQLKISDAEHTEAIATIESNVDNHAREISALKAKDATHDTEIAELDKVTDALTKEIPNGITLYRDGTGKIKAVISQEDDTTIDSNVLDMIIPYQYDIISGTTSRSFKLDITMSDGTKYTTNDFVIPAGGGTSVSITAITLTKNADNPNKFKVSVKLDDGSTIESGEIEMVTSVSGTFANNKLTITVNGISSTPITIDTTGTTYTAGNGIKIASGVISIDDTKVALKSDISDMETKTHANATFATKTALTTLQNATKVAVENFAITESADKVTITTTAIDGATSKSEDIPAVTDTMAGIVTPELKKKWDSSNSGGWTVTDKSISDVMIDTGTGITIPNEFIIEYIQGSVTYTFSGKGVINSMIILPRTISYTDLEMLDITYGDVQSYNIYWGYAHGAGGLFEPSVRYKTTEISKYNSSSVDDDTKSYLIWLKS